MNDVQIRSIAWTRLMSRLCCAAAACFAATIPAAVRAAEHTAAYAIFKSTDHGRSWSRADAGMPRDARINAFAASDASLFAGTDSGIHVSADEGLHWRPSAGLAMTSGRVLALAALDRNLYAATDRSGLLMSADRGATWAINASLKPRRIRSLLADHGKLYAGTDSEGVFVSSDNGKRWTSMIAGLPDAAQIFALSAVNGRLFAALYSRGLYSWDEPRKLWTRVSTVRPLALATAGDTLVAGHNPGGIDWSNDDGATWSHASASAIGNVGPALQANVFEEFDGSAPVWTLGAAGDALYAGAAAGIYYSEDRGRTWSRAHAGLPASSPGVSFLVGDRFVLAGVMVDDARTE